MSICFSFQVLRDFNNHSCRDPACDYVDILSVIIQYAETILGRLKKNRLKTVDNDHFTLVLFGIKPCTAFQVRLCHKKEPVAVLVILEELQLRIRAVFFDFSEPLRHIAHGH